MSCSEVQVILASFKRVTASRAFLKKDFSKPAAVLLNVLQDWGILSNACFEAYWSLASQLASPSLCFGIGGPGMQRFLSFLHGPSNFPNLRFSLSFSCSLPLWKTVLYILVNCFWFCFSLMQIIQRFQMVLQNQSLHICAENKISIVLTYIIIQYLCSFGVKILQVFGNWELKFLAYKPFYRYTLS